MYIQVLQTQRLLLLTIIWHTVCITLCMMTLILILMIPVITVIALNLLTLALTIITGIMKLMCSLMGVKI